MLVHLKRATTIVLFRRRTRRRKIFPFFSLPREIRDMIYEFLHDPSDPTMFILRSRHDPDNYVLRRDRNGIPLHAFLISHQFTSELSAAFYRTAIFVAAEFTNACGPPFYMPRRVPQTPFLASTPALCRLRHLVLVFGIMGADGWKSMLQQCAPLLALTAHMPVLQSFYLCIRRYGYSADEWMEYLSLTLPGLRRAQEDDLAIFAAKLADMLWRRGCVAHGPKRIDKRNWHLSFSFKASRTSPVCHPPNYALEGSGSVRDREALTMDITTGLDDEKVPNVVRGVEPYVRKGRNIRKFITFPQDLWLEEEEKKKKKWQFWRSS